MGSSNKKTTVGYKYYWDIHSGLGRGPVDELVEITADNRIVLATREKQITSNTTVYIDKPDLFGGTDVSGEGGIQGQLDIMFGERDQVPGSLLKGLLSGLIPGFRGIVSTCFSGMVSAYSASPKPWSFRVRRVVKGWDNGMIWYPEKALIRLRNDAASLDTSLSAEETDNLRTIHAMNPAHILMEAAVSRDWGRGLTIDDLNLSSYKKMADTLFSENFGLCFRYNRQDNLDDFIQKILDHIGGIQYVDMRTGKLTVALIRNDYNADEIPLFNYENGILNIQDTDSSGGDSAPNEILVKYHDPVTNTNISVRAQNLASIQSVGLISQTKDYPAIPVQDLACRVAQRDLETGTAGIKRFVLMMDRRAGDLLPASVFRISLQDRQIENMVVRVGSVSENEDGSLTVKVIQDVFGLPATVYSSGQPPAQWAPPDFETLPIVDQQVIETPRYLMASELTSADLNMVQMEDCGVMILASAPSPTSICYQIESRSQGQEFSRYGSGDWEPIETLVGDIGLTDTTIKIAGQLSTALPGCGLLINEEIMRIDAVDTINSLLKVGRGCADTIPQPHGSGARIWILNDYAESDNVVYLPGETVDVRLLTVTSAGMLDPSIATLSTLIMKQRQARPYPPGFVRINGEILSKETLIMTVPFSIRWAHRDRLTQADNLVAHSEGDTGPENGTTYRIRLLKGGIQKRIIKIHGNVFSYPDEEVPASGESFDLIELYSIRDDLESWQRYTINADINTTTV
nr:hypothetical protein [uncultured Enterobacter sp.]